jgi:hypothetical protein
MMREGVERAEAKNILNPIGSGHTRFVEMDGKGIMGGLTPQCTGRTQVVKVKLSA